MSKRCPDCKETKPAEAFAKSKARIDGLDIYCRECAGRRRIGKPRRREKHPLVKETLPPNLKRCSKCKEVKLKTDFSPQRLNMGGLRYECKKCNCGYRRRNREQNPEKHAKQNREWAAKWRRENPEKLRDSIRKRVYGVPHGWTAATLKAQGGGCAICGAVDTGKPRFFHIDHCHATKKVRGVLCSECNIGLGRFRDRPEILREAADYLERHT